MIKFIMVRILAKSSAGCHNSSNQKVFLKSQLGFRHCRAAMGFHYIWKRLLQGLCKSGESAGRFAQEGEKKESGIPVDKNQFKVESVRRSRNFHGAGLFADFRSRCLSNSLEQKIQVKTTPQFQGLSVCVLWPMRRPVWCESPWPFAPVFR
jgi:hypothetical protein